MFSEYLNTKRFVANIVKKIYLSLVFVNRFLD